MGGYIPWSSIIYRRFRQLLVPFILWSIIEIVLYKSCTLADFINIFIYPDGYFWFLWVLFFITVFFQLGGRLSGKLKQEIVIIGFCSLFVGLMVFANIRVLGYQFFAYYFLFYTVGYYLNKYNHWVTRKGWLLSLLAGVWAVMAWFWKMHELPVFLKGLSLSETFLQYGYRFFTALVAVYVLLGIAPTLFNKPIYLGHPLITLGTVSLGVYVVHLLLMPITVRYVSVVYDRQGAVIALSFMIALLLSCLVVWLLGRWKWSKMLLLGKI